MRIDQAVLDERPLGDRAARMQRRTVVRHVRPGEHEQRTQRPIEVERIRPAACFDERTGHRPADDRAQIRAHDGRREDAHFGRRCPGGEELVRGDHNAALHDARHQYDGGQRLERVLGRPGAEQLQNGGQGECGEHQLAHVPVAIEQNAERYDDDSGAGEATGQQNALLQR